MALKEAQGPFLTSMFGYTLGYNALDNNKNPTNGLFAEFRQDIAGAGGDEHYVRTTGDLRYYHEIYDQIVGLVHLQGGDLAAFGGNQLRIVDNFNLGPTLVRGFAPFGIGPRDIGTGDPQGNPLGGTKYYGGSLEVQFPLYGLPRVSRPEGSFLRRRRHIVRIYRTHQFQSERRLHPKRRLPGLHARQLHNRWRRLYADPDVRGRFDHLVVAARTYPLRLRQGHHQEPIRSDSVLPLQRRHHFLTKRPTGRFSRRSPRLAAAPARQILVKGAE